MRILKLRYRQTEISIYESDTNNWVCPVCGYPKLNKIPYSFDEVATFTMCPYCMFEFGFDDDPSASNEACFNIIESWRTYRNNFLEEITDDIEKVKKVKEWLKDIGVNID